MNIIAITIASLALAFSGYIGWFVQNVGSEVQTFGASILSIPQGGTGQSSFGQGFLYSSGAGTSTVLSASTSAATLDHVISTSTTATSTFAFGVQATSFNGTTGTSTFSALQAATLNLTSSTSTFQGLNLTRFNTSATSTGSAGINLQGGCFAISGTCLSSSSGGAYTYITTVVATSSTAAFPVSLSSTYKNYQFVFSNVTPSNNGTNLRIQTSTNGGSTYNTSGYTNADGSTNAIHMLQFDGSTDTTIQNTTGADQPYGVSGVAYLYNPSGTQTYKWFSGNSSGRSSVSGPNGIGIFQGSYDSLTAVNNVQFIFSAGTIATGTLDIFGIKQSN